MMRIKFLLFPAVLIVLIALASCTKSTTTTITKVDTVLYIDTTTQAASDSISADIDGLLFAADSGVYYNFDHQYYNYGTWNVVEFKSDDAKGNDFHLWFGTSANAFTAKTYGAFGDNNTLAGIEFDSTGGGSFWTSTILNPATITITSVTSTSVKATFNGTLYPDGDSTQPGKVITNGKFALALF
jgi:hypothetical protein